MIIEEKLQSRIFPENSGFPGIGPNGPKTAQNDENWQSRISPEKSGFPDFGPNGPKMAQNGPKWPKNGGKSKISGKWL